MFSNMDYNTGTQITNTLPRCPSTISEKQKKLRLLLLGSKEGGPMELGFQSEAGFGYAETGEGSKYRV